MFNLIISIMASLLLLVGIISMLTPFPGGTALIALSLTMLICSSPRAQYCIKWIRTRIRWFNKLFFWLERKVGSRIKVVGTALEKTRPHPAPENKT